MSYVGMEFIAYLLTNPSIRCTPHVEQEFVSTDVRLNKGETQTGVYIALS